MVKRVASKAHGRSKPLWFFFPVLIGGALPWTAFAPWILGAAWKRLRSAVPLRPWQGMLLGSIPDNWESEPIASGAVTPAKKITLDKGVMVIGLSDSCPYVRQGIRSGDIITHVGSKPVTDIVELQQVLNDVPLDRCDITIAGKAKVVAVISE